MAIHGLLRYPIIMKYIDGSNGKVSIAMLESDWQEVGYMSPDGLSFVTDYKHVVEVTTIDDNKSFIRRYSLFVDNKQIGCYAISHEALTTFSFVALREVIFEAFMQLLNNSEYIIPAERVLKIVTSLFPGNLENELVNLKTNLELMHQNRMLEAKANSLPGIRDVIPGDRLADAGCECSLISELPIRPAIMHLNDIHKVSRERIADWLDTLHDDGIIDIEF